ncbi:hypothetical protein ABKN59_004100 [Abortiporus biennis]
MRDTYKASEDPQYGEKPLRTLHVASCYVCPKPDALQIQREDARRVSTELKSVASTQPSGRYTSYTNRSITQNYHLHLFLLALHSAQLIFGNILSVFLHILPLAFPYPTTVQKSLCHRHPNSNNNLFGVGMGAAHTLKALNPSWQVWAGVSPSSRNPSGSSIASMPEPSPSHGNGGYRSNGEESWNATRNSSGAWEDVNAHSRNIDSMHNGRHRQGKSAQYSPQRYDNGTAKEPATPSRYTPTSPTRNVGYGPGSSPFSVQQPLLSANANGTYDATQVEAELTVALRGMAVEDDYAAQTGAYRAQMANQAAAQSATQNRGGVPSMQQTRGGFNGFPQPDYSAYYTGPTPYPYDAYRATPDPSLYGGSPALSTAAAAGVFPGLGPQALHPTMTDMHGQQFYDYNSTGRPASQYYYPTQPMMYPGHPPLHSGMPPASLSNKKQQGMQQNIVYGNVRANGSHPQNFAQDYSNQLPMMIPGMIFGHAGMAPAGSPQFSPGNRGRRGGHDTNAGAERSQLLDEFRSNKTRTWELKDIFNHIVEFSGDQHGSRFIQQKLENATGSEKQLVFDEIVPHHSLQLVQDVFGNYVIQKLFEYGTPAQKSQLAGTMKGHILALSLQMYGCRVVQKAVEFVTPEQQSAFVKELDGNVLQCVKDANGNHVIQKLIERVSPERLGFVDAFRGHVLELASHPYGCRVLQRCLEYLPDDQTRPLLNELHESALKLMQDQFGNYVVQFILERGQPEDSAMIVSKLRGHIITLARHKFASNVCEKALLNAQSEIRHLLIEEMMTPKQPEGGNPVAIMMRDQYANYVLQKALTVAEGEQKEALIAKIRPLLSSMRKVSGGFSKHLTAIERLLDKCTSPNPNEQKSKGRNAPVTSTPATDSSAH